MSPPPPDRPATSSAVLDLIAQESPYVEFTHGLHGAERLLSVLLPHRVVNRDVAAYLWEARRFITRDHIDVTPWAAAGDERCVTMHGSFVFESVNETCVDTSLLQAVVPHDSDDDNADDGAPPTKECDLAPLVHDTTAPALPWAAGSAAPSVYRTTAGVWAQRLKYATAPSLAPPDEHRVPQPNSAWGAMNRQAEAAVALDPTAAVKEPRCPPLLPPHSLTVRSCTAKALFSLLEYFPRLSSLNLTGNYLSNQFDLADIADYLAPTLRSLELSVDSVDLLSLPAIAQLRNLTRLSIAWVEQGVLSVLCSSLKALQVLSLTDLDGGVSALTALPVLEQVHLIHCEGVGASHESLARCRALKTLTLERCVIAGSLTWVASAPRFEELTLQVCTGPLRRMTRDLSAAVVAKKPSLVLRLLDHVDDDPWRAFAGLDNIQALPFGRINAAGRLDALCDAHFRSDAFFASRMVMAPRTVVPASALRRRPPLPRAVPGLSVPKKKGAKKPPQSTVAPPLEETVATESALLENRPFVPILCHPPCDGLPCDALPLAYKLTVLNVTVPAAAASVAVNLGLCRHLKTFSLEGPCPPEQRS